MLDRNQFMAGCRDIVQELDFERHAMAVVLDDVDDDDQVMYFRFEDNDRDLATQEKELNAELVNRGHQWAALVSRAQWSRTATGTSHPSWMVVVAERSMWNPCTLLMFQLHDRSWHRVDGEIPWIAASTAGGLREALVNGKPLTIKATGPESDPELFSAVQDSLRRGRSPRVDEAGRL